ncbi:MAG: flagellar filament capping protein FliD [bacterium]
MADPVRLGGFYASFDTEAVITQLTNVRMNAVTLLQNKSAKETQKKSAVAAVQTAVTALLAKLNTLSATNSVSGKSAISGSTAVSATTSPSSLLGQFTVNVTKLANASTLVGTSIAAPIDQSKAMNESNFGTVPSNGSYTISTATGGAKTFGISGGPLQSAALLNAGNIQLPVTSGTFTISTATGGAATLTVDPTTQSLDDVIAAINGSGIGVTASITNDQYGHANQISVVSTQGDITFGSGSDTSTFLTATNLLASSGTTTRTSSTGMTKMMTLSDVVADINASTIGVTASITNDAQGRANILTIASSQGNITFGNGGDTSNFLSASGLLTSSSGATRSSISPLSRAQQTGPLATTPFFSGTVAAGDHNLVINGKNIAYNSATDSLADIINRINGSDASVTARYDSISDTIKLQNTKTGPLTVTVADDGAGGDLAAKLGLLAATTTDGQNAEYSIDGGPTQTSATNSINYNGIALTFNALTGTPATVSVSQDTATALTGLKGFVTEFNNVMTLIDKVTKADGSKTNNTSGPLSGDTSLRQLKSDLRSILGGVGVNINGSFSTLAQIGLSFGAVGAAVGTTNTLVLDDAKFQAALAQDPAGTQSLLSSLTLGATLDPGGTSSISSLTGAFTGSQAGRYSIQDDGAGNLVSTFTPSNGGPPVTTSATVSANGATTLLIPGMTVNIGALLQAGTHTVTVAPSSQSVIQKLKQFADIQAGAGGVLQKRQESITKVTTDIADRIDKVQTRITNEMEVLRKKFAIMEQAQAKAQGIISGLQAQAAKSSNN